MAVDHSACGSMKTGVKPENVCELQDTNDHRQVERKWRLSAFVDEPSAVEGRVDKSAHAVLVTVCAALDDSQRTGAQFCRQYRLTRLKYTRCTNCTNVTSIAISVYASGCVCVCPQVLCGLAAHPLAC